jgi:hypothetical protein
MHSVELPSLYNVSGNFFFNTTIDTSVNTYPLKSVGNLTLWGNLTSYVSLPLLFTMQTTYHVSPSINVTSIQTITSTEVLASIYGIECASPSVSPPWLSNTTLAIDGYAYKATGPWTYICYPGVKFHRKKLYPVSTGGIVGISVGIGIPLLLFVVWFVHRRGNKKIALEVEKRRQARL